MPGFAAAKPGTGQTARAIIAPASCRHDNCCAHCLIIAAYQTLPFTSPLSGLCLPGTRQVRLYITGVLCKLARGNDEPHAAIAPTALVTAHDQRPVELGRASAALPPRTCPAPGKPLRAFRRRNNARLPGRVVIPCHPPALSDYQRSRLPVAALSGHWVVCRKRFKTSWL